MKVDAQSIQVCTSAGTRTRYGSLPAAASPVASKNRANVGSAPGLARTGQAARDQKRWSGACCWNARAKVACSCSPTAVSTAVTSSVVVPK